MRSSQYTAPYSITWQCAAFLLGEITSDTCLLKDSRDFSREELLTMIQEAESLATHIDTLDENQEQMRLIYRWAELADEVAKLMVLAEELLSEDELLDLQKVVNEQDKTRWNKYRRNIRWMNELPGQEQW